MKQLWPPILIFNIKGFQNSFGFSMAKTKKKCVDLKFLSQWRWVGIAKMGFIMMQETACDGGI